LSRRLSPKNCTCVGGTCTSMSDRTHASIVQQIMKTMSELQQLESMHVEQSQTRSRFPELSSSPPLLLWLHTEEKACSCKFRNTVTRAGDWRSSKVASSTRGALFCLSCTFAPLCRSLHRYRDIGRWREGNRAESQGQSYPMMIEASFSVCPVRRLCHSTLLSRYSQSYSRVFPVRR
jgi:hypothetical protein